MSPKEIREKAIEQMFNRDKVSGLDVVIWIARHIGWLIMVAVFLSGVGSIAWSAYMKDKVACIAGQLDAPILVRVDENRKLGRKTYYKTAKIEYILKKTAPEKVVKDAEEWLEIEMWRAE